MSEGWITIHREIQSHWVFKDPEEFRLEKGIKALKTYFI